MHRPIAALMAAAGWWLIGCREVPAPQGGVFSISTLQLPSPGVVAGDTMRDSTGVVAPLRVIAYNTAGDTIQNAVATFVVLDTGAHLSGSLLVGDSVGRTVRVVGSVEALQTLPTSVKVTLSPDTLVAADSSRHVRTYSATTSDTVVSSAPLTTRAAHRNGTLTDVDAVIVRYAVVRSPPSKDGGPTIVLLNGSTIASRDTTEGGRAAIVARLRLNSFLITGADSAIVEATASHRGQTIGIVQFTVVYTPQ